MLRVLNCSRQLVRVVLLSRCLFFRLLIKRGLPLDEVLNVLHQLDGALRQSVRQLCMGLRHARPDEFLLRELFV